MDLNRRRMPNGNLDYAFEIGLLERLSARGGTELLRMVQEALTNVLKHAGPARARVGVRFTDRELELQITDDGHGPSGDANGAGHGLVGMRERAAFFGGVVHARTEPGGGFAVRARLPIDPPAP